MSAMYCGGYIVFHSELLLTEALLEDGKSGKGRRMMETLTNFFPVL